MKTWSSLVAFVLMTAAVAHAASFYGTIRITSDGIPGSGVSFSTSLVDFLAPAGPPNGQALVQMVVTPDFNSGPTLGSTALVKDFTPGSSVTDFVTFSTMSPGPGYNNGVVVPPIWSAYDTFGPPLGQPGGQPPFVPPYLGNPTGCAPNPFPFCVVNNLAGSGSVVFFELRGGTTNQLGYWQALVGAWLPQSPAEVTALLQGGQTLASTAFTADVTTAPEPATHATVLISICLLVLVQRRSRVHAH